MYKLDKLKLIIVQVLLVQTRLPRTDIKTDLRLTLVVNLIFSTRFVLNMSRIRVFFSIDLVRFVRCFLIGIPTAYSIFRTLDPLLIMRRALSRIGHVSSRIYALPISVLLSTLQCSENCKRKTRGVRNSYWIWSVHKL